MKNGFPNLDLKKIVFLILINQVRHSFILNIFVVGIIFKISFLIFLILLNVFKKYHVPKPQNRMTRITSKENIITKEL
jgi:hypothetical protein